MPRALSKKRKRDTSQFGNFLDKSNEKMKQNFLKELHKQMEKGDVKTSEYKALLSKYLQLIDEIKNENEKIFEGKWILINKAGQKIGEFDADAIFLNEHFGYSPTGYCGDGPAPLQCITKEFEKTQKFKFQGELEYTLHREWNGSMSVEVNEEGNLKIFVKIDQIPQEDCCVNCIDPYIYDCEDYSIDFECLGFRESDIPKLKPKKKRKVNKRKK